MMKELELKSRKERSEEVTGICENGKVRRLRAYGSHVMGGQDHY